MILVVLLGTMNELILTLSLESRARYFWYSVTTGERTHHTLVKNGLNVLINYPMVKNLSEAMTNVTWLGKDVPGLYSLRQSTKKASPQNVKRISVQVSLIIHESPAFPNNYISQLGIIIFQIS